MNLNPYCDFCALRDKAPQICQGGHGDVPADVMFITDQPDAKPLETWKWLKKKLPKEVKFFVASAVKCFPGWKQKKVKRAGVLNYRKCFPYLHGEWQRVQPRVCVLLGARALAMVFPKAQFTMARGKLLKHPVLGPCISTYGPGHISLYPQYEGSFDADLRDILSFVSTGHITVRDVGLPEGIEIFDQPHNEHDESRIRYHLEQASKRDFIASDVETNSLEWWSTDFAITHLGVAWDPANGLVFDPRVYPREYRWFTELRNHGVHGAHYEGSLFPYGHIKYDSYNLAHLHDPGQFLNLENCSRRYLNEIGWKGSEKTWMDWAKRCGKDVVVEFKLIDHLRQLITAKQMRIHDEIMLPSTVIMGRWKNNPIKIDREYQRDVLEPELSTSMLRLQERALREYGFVGNLGSHEQVREWMYNRLGITIPPGAFDEDGKHSTAAQFLAELELTQPFAGIIRAFRKEQKLKSNYIYDDDYLRPEVRACGTVSGRPAADHVHTFARDKRVRRSYIAKRGFLLEGDLSQIELVLGGGIYAQDYTMVKAFKEGLDLHAITCTDVLGAPLTKANRQKAKPINFLFLYGGKEYIFRVTALKDYGINFSEAESHTLRERWFRRYPGIGEWHRKNRIQILKHGWIESLLGRKYLLPGGLSNNYKVVDETAKHAHNYPVQGDGSLVNLLGLIESYKIDPMASILTVHDCVINDIEPQYALDFAYEWGNKWMERINEYWPLDERAGVPIKAEFKGGPSLGQLQPICINESCYNAGRTFA